MNKKKHPTHNTDVGVLSAGVAKRYRLHRPRLPGLRTQVFGASRDVSGTWCRTGDSPNFDMATAHSNAMPAVTS